MEPMKPLMQCRCRQCLLATSAALFELRDALNLLSLALKDWQFETDQERRASAEQYVNRLMTTVATMPDQRPP